MAVDIDGRLLMVNLTTADIADGTGAQAVMDGLRLRWPWIEHLFGDGAYDRRQMMDRAVSLDFVVDIVRMTDPGFTVRPRRWVVERSFRLADPLPSPGARLRSTPPCFRSHDLRRNEQLNRQAYRAPTSCQTDSHLFGVGVSVTITLAARVRKKAK